MASATTSSTQKIQEHDEDEVTSYKNKNDGALNREEIKSAIAKAIELRALHASLLQQQQGNYNNPIKKFPSSASPTVSLHSHHFSAQDYPIFTPVSPFSFLITLLEADSEFKDWIFKL